MKSHRREFLKRGGCMLGTAGISKGLSLVAAAAEPPSFIVRAPTMKVSICTYNIAKDWDLANIIKNCDETKFQGVELRTRQAHGVEVGLKKEQRGEVKKRFQDSPVALMGLGSAFDYHTPDQSKLRADIAATKE